jgi:hypothetical protein
VPDLPGSFHHSSPAFREGFRGTVSETFRRVPEWFPRRGCETRVKLTRRNVGDRFFSNSPVPKPFQTRSQPVPTGNGSVCCGICCKCLPPKRLRVQGPDIRCTPSAPAYFQPNDESLWRRRETRVGPGGRCGENRQGSRPPAPGPLACGFADPAAPRGVSRLPPHVCCSVGCCVCGCCRFLLPTLLIVAGSPRRVSSPTNSTRPLSPR